MRRFSLHPPFPLLTSDSLSSACELTNYLLRVSLILVLVLAVPDAGLGFRLCSFAHSASPCCLVGGDGGKLLRSASTS
jgi:hypothetical protein